MFAVALDGPAGAGKSTIARKVAQHYNILYLDTGAMYRAVGWKAVSLGIAVKDEPAVSQMLSETIMDIRFQKGEQHVYIDNQDVSGLIRTPEMSKAASDISTLTCVRKYLVDMQRQLAGRQPLVIDGRDIGTYVLPDAPWKFFLTASVDERARRRMLQLKEKGDSKVSLEEVREEIAARDKQDTTRAVAPLAQAKDAILLDTTDLSIQQVVDAIIGRIGVFAQDNQTSDSYSESIRGNV